MVQVKLLFSCSYLDTWWMHRDRSRSAERSVRDHTDRLTQWRQARRGGKADKRRGKSIILKLLETLIRIIDATQQLEFTNIGSRRRDYVHSVHESIRSNQWLPKKHGPILDRWEESDIDSDLAESWYNESEAEEDFVPCNDPFRPTSRYSETRPEPVVLSARPSSVASTVGFRNTGGAASSTDIVAASSSDSETEIVQVEESLQPLPPPPQEYLIDWEYLRRAGVTIADPNKGEIVFSPSHPDPPFQGKILSDQRSTFSIDFHNVN